MFLNGVERDICEPLDELVIWQVSGFLVGRESSCVSLLKSSSVLSTGNWSCHKAAQDNLHIPCSHLHIPCSDCITLSEHPSFWCRFILTGNNRTTQVCCQTRILMDAILLNQISKNGLKRSCNQQLNVEPVLPACSNTKQDLD